MQGFTLSDTQHTASEKEIIMEYTRRCNVCGKIYCYTDQDLNNSKTNAVAGAISAIGAVASVFGGTAFDTYELNKMSDRAADKVIDYEKCPNCGSSRTSVLTADELAKYKNNDQANTATTHQMPQMVPINTNASTESLVERGMLFLEDQEWDKANAYFENVLDADPKNVQAYIGKLLVDLRLSKIELLDSCEKDFKDNPNYRKALRFATEKEKALLESLTKERIYKKAIAAAETDYRKAIELLSSIKDYKDASQLIDSYLEIINNNAYEKALSLGQSESISKLTEAAGILDELGDYKDAKKIAAEYRTRIEKLKAEEEKRKHEEKVRREKALQEEETRRRKEREDKEAADIIIKKRNRKIGTAVALFAALGIAFYSILAFNNHRKAEEEKARLEELQNKYEDAESLLEDGKYDEAEKEFLSLGDYKDSSTRVSEYKEEQYQHAESILSQGKYEDAGKIFSDLGNYKDSSTRVSDYKEEQYQHAESLLAEEKYEEAQKIYSKLGEYLDSTAKAEETMSKALHHKLQKAQVGEYIEYGKNEDGNSISWRILDKKDDKLLLISKDQICESAVFTEYSEEWNWANSSIREYLNDDFVFSSFTEDEIAMIDEEEVKSKTGPTKDRVNSRDKVFLLSEEEAEKYFTDDEDRCEGMSESWLLRDVVSNHGEKWKTIQMNIVRDNGDIMSYPIHAGDIVGVRPAMWINVK